MANRFESVANAAVLLGSVFYQDPSSEKGQAVLGWFASPEAADAWEFGQPQAGQGIAPEILAGGGRECLRTIIKPLFPK